VRAGVVGPFAQAVERPLRLALEERPDRELGREALGELVLGAHRGLPVVEPVRGDEVHMRRVEERVHAHRRVGRDG